MPVLFPRTGHGSLPAGKPENHMRFISEVARSASKVPFRAMPSIYCFFTPSLRFFTASSKFEFLFIKFLKAALCFKINVKGA